MLAEERLSRIMKLLSQQRTATVQELCEALDASESTIRRDLNELDRMGKVNKVHGGATLPDSQFLADEPTMAAKETLAVGQKRSIAQAAADLVRAGDFVYIDAGSTTVKAVAVNSKEEIIFSRYLPNAGNPVPLARDFLTELYEKYPDIQIRSSASTGYGEEIIKNAFGLDGSVIIKDNREIFVFMIH